MRPVQCARKRDAGIASGRNRRTGAPSPRCHGRQRDAFFKDPPPFLPEKGKSEQCPDKKDGFARSLSLRRLSPASVLSKRKARAEARILSSRQGPPTRTGAGIGKGARRCTPWPWPPAGRIFQRSPALFSRKKENQNNALTKKTGAPVRFPFVGFPLLPFCRKEKAGRKRASFPPAKGRRQERGPGSGRGRAAARHGRGRQLDAFSKDPPPFSPGKRKIRTMP